MTMTKPLATLSATLPSRSQTRVLVLDDDSFQLDLISELLKGLGFGELTCVTSSAEAMRKIAGKPGSFDLVLIDLHLPGEDGFHFMEGLAKTAYKGGLIIVSGQSQDVMRGAALVAKLRRFTLLGTLTKPVEREPLAALVGGMCSS
jgi:CheY-like chemotaxis protein